MSACSVQKRIDTNTNDIPLNSDYREILKNADCSDIEFYWLDACELDISSFGLIGAVSLFGKISIPNKNSREPCQELIDHSCCCIVKDIPRILYLLPKHLYSGVGFLQCYEEFNLVANKYHIMEFSSRKVIKGCCFCCNNVPSGTEFLEIRYSRTYPSIPNDLQMECCICFGHTSDNILETLIVQNNIRGPSWLMLKNFTVLPSNSISWSNITLSIIGLDNIQVLQMQPPPPKFIAMSLCVKYLQDNDSELNKEIAIIGYGVDYYREIDNDVRDHYFCPSAIFISSHHISDNLPADIDLEPLIHTKDCKTFFHKDEKSLLKHFLNQLYEIDPDFFFGHDTNFWLDLIHTRSHFHRLNICSVIGRLRQPTYKPYKKPFQSKIAIGRVVFDLCHSSKDFIKLDSYDIASLSLAVLNRIHHSYNQIQVRELLTNSTDSIILCMNNVLIECELLFILEGHLNIIQLAYQLTILAGNVFSRTLLGGRAERNDYLLLHAFHSGNYILPNKNYQVIREKHFVLEQHSNYLSRKKSTYMGGLVFEPKKGLYDTYTLVLDFNSLYPSLIQEYNICFSTLDMFNSTDYSNLQPVSSKLFGVIPQELQSLVNRRKKVKLMMKEFHPSSSEYSKYFILQKAIKLTANSIYGCLGYPQSRFYAKSFASLVTSLGREVLSNTKFFVENSLGLEVIYGDTDSIMINTNLVDYNQVEYLGNLVKSMINDQHKMLEIDIDSIYRRLLLLKKKKYAALAVDILDDGKYSERIDLKGLDIIRRDWCGLTKIFGKYIVEKILTSNHDSIIPQIREFLSTISEKLQRNHYSIKEFTIFKTLTKLPEDYLDSNLYPHVVVANWIKKNGGRIAIGQVIPYVICTNSSSKDTGSHKAYHPDQLQESLGVYDANIQISIDYYLSNQIFPVISRLCAPLVDPIMISECIGISSVSLKAEPIQLFNRQVDQVSGTDLSIKCPYCDKDVLCSSPATFQSIITCNSCFTGICFQRVQLIIILELRERIRMLYIREQKCVELDCSYISRNLNYTYNFESQYSFCYNCYNGKLKSVIRSLPICHHLDYLKFSSELSSHSTILLNLLTTYSSSDIICLNDLY